MRYMALLLVFVLLTPFDVWAQAVEAVYPKRYGADKGRDTYPVAVLKLILEKSGQSYQMRSSQAEMTQRRALLSLEQNEEITVAWVGTSDIFEKRFRPIRFPIYRGLLGYRLFIIHKAQQSVFNKVTTLERLSHFRAGQGSGWSDIEILESAGLTVHAAPYDSIIKLISNRRVDYFPRGVNEAYPEVHAQIKEYPELAVEERLLLVYPFALFFFVNRDNEALAQVLESGFEKAYEDGSFVSLFNKHPHIIQILDRAKLGKRIRFDIPNPFLTPDTAAIAKEFWYRPD